MWKYILKYKLFIFKYIIMHIVYVWFYVEHIIENDDIYINLLKNTNHTIDKISYTFDKISNNIVKYIPIPFTIFNPSTNLSSILSTSITFSTL